MLCNYLQTPQPLFYTEHYAQHKDKKYRLKSHVQFEPPLCAGTFLINNRILTVVDRQILQINGLEIKKIQEVPAPGHGHSRGAVYNGQLLVTDEKKFYLLDGNQLVEKQFFYAGEQILSTDTGLGGFHKHTVADTFLNGVYRVFLLKENECTMLYAGSYVLSVMNKHGLAVYKVSEAWDCVVVDLTVEDPQPRYVRVKPGLPVQCAYGFEFEEQVMRRLIPDYDTFVQRRQQICEAQRLQAPQFTVPEDVNKFNRTPLLDFEPGEDVFTLKDINGIINRIENRHYVRKGLDVRTQQQAVRRVIARVARRAALPQ